ncbi:MAG: hypothetical protein ABJA89_13575 [Lapillicoccus sp.]
MKKRSWGVAVAAAVALSIGGASTAFAGESTGNGKETGMRGHANSICGFSGQNPERFLDPTDPNYEPGHTQSWGQIPKEFRAFLTSIGENPGSACNGSLNPMK